jgi:hypothetical protein
MVGLMTFSGLRRSIIWFKWPESLKKPFYFNSRIAIKCVPYPVIVRFRIAEYTTNAVEITPANGSFDILPPAFVLGNPFKVLESVRSLCDA